MSHANLGNYRQCIYGETRLCGRRMWMLEGKMAKTGSQAIVAHVR